ncbi:MAG: hypothetical protein AAF984_09555, partial [Verrucomicrobiota bacterium]
KISEFSYGVFWLVLPSLGFFVALPFCLQRFDFLLSMILATLVTIILYGLLLWILLKFGIKLF